MPGTHIIRRQLLEVDYEGAESSGYALQSQLLDLCEHALLPALEEVFERLAPAGEHWRIDRLVVDVGELPHDGLDGALVSAVVEAVDRQLRERAVEGRIMNASDDATLAKGDEAPSGAVTAIRRSGGQVLREAFFHFLETGLLPWWIQLPAEQTLEDAIRAAWARQDDAGDSPGTLVATLARHFDAQRTRRRLVRQFSPDFLATLLAEASRSAADVVRSVLAALARAGITTQTEPNFVFQLWESALVTSFAQQSVTSESLICDVLRAMATLGSPPADTLLRKLSRQWPSLASTAQAGPGASPPVAVAATTSAEKKLDLSAAEPAITADLADGVFLRCAGIVLLHPFLPRFFDGLGIARNDQLLQPERALGLLHYLATGQRTAPEYDLLLPKLLCGVSRDAIVPLQIDLRPEEEDESQALLGAVIRHWNALGATSVDGLRGSYLVRPGKLSSRGEDYVLQVESRAYDILMDQLPWGIGLVKLPWMKSILWVEWRL